jgi:hypothetical protein
MPNITITHVEKFECLLLLFSVAFRRLRNSNNPKVRTPKS